jgi:GNAT superfamily N-acetyltransferase
MTLEEDRLLDKYSHLRQHSLGKWFPALQIHYIAVQKELQGQGIGTIIMGRIVEIFRGAANSLGTPVMTLVALNPRAARLYGSLGFVSYGGSGSTRMLLPALSVLDLVGDDTEAVC